MVAIMHDARGVGLAAAQVGSLRRLAVVFTGEDDAADRALQPGDRLALRGGGDRLRGLPLDRRDQRGGAAVGGDPRARPGRRGQHLRARARRASRRGSSSTSSTTSTASSSSTARRPSSAGRRSGRCATEADARMRVAFAGSPEAAVAPLRALAASRQRSRSSSPSPTSARGRSRRTSPTPGRRAPRRSSASRSLARRRSTPPRSSRRSPTPAPRRCVVVAFGQILRDGVLVPLALRQRPLLAAARLPRRGPGGAGDHGRRRGDRGDDHAHGGRARHRPDDLVRARRRGRGRGRRRARRRACRGSGGPLLVRRSTTSRPGGLTPVPQPDEGVSFAPKITAEDRVLDLARPAVELARRMRALAPHIGAVCRIGGEPFKVWRARARRRARAAPACRWSTGRLVAGCGEGSLEMLELQPPGRGRMDAAAFLRGWRGALEWGSANDRADRGRRRCRARAQRRAARAAPRGRRAPTPTARSPPRCAAPSSTRARAPRPPGWPTARCSAGARSTG